VSGTLTPDTYIVEKGTWHIVEKKIQTQERALERKLGGGNEWSSLTFQQGQRQKLSDERIPELARLVMQIESYYGFPVDVEWALSHDRFHILQSRPITTLTSRKFVLDTYKKGIELKSTVK